ncbi:hypothetical protein BJX70DRAFT_402391 [Aspergillus crustosus]
MDHKARSLTQSRYRRRLKAQAVASKTGKITKKPPSIWKTFDPADLDLKAQLPKPTSTGKAHAAEVTRRKDRQTSALPPPGPPKSGVRPSQTRSSRNRRRRAAGEGGFNSDTDSGSDDDERRGNSSGAAVSSHRQPPARQEMDFSQQIPTLDIPMRAFLRSLETEIASSVPLSEQTKQQIQLLHDIPPSERPIGDTILAHADKLTSDLFEENLLAFMNVMRAASTDTDADKSSLREMMQAGRIWCEYVTAPSKIPECAFMLPEWMTPRFWHSPFVFRVFVMDSRYIYAEPVLPHQLKNSGWMSCYDNRALTWFYSRYQRGDAESTRNIVYRVRMTGEVDGIWRPDDSQPEDGLLQFPNRSETVKRGPSWEI